MNDLISNAFCGHSFLFALGDDAQRAVKLRHRHIYTYIERYTDCLGSFLVVVAHQLVVV